MSDVVYTDSLVRTARNKAGAEMATLLGVHPDREGREGVPWSVNPSLGEIIPCWRNTGRSVCRTGHWGQTCGDRRDRHRGRALPRGIRTSWDRLSGHCRKIAVRCRSWHRPGKPDSFQAGGDPVMTGTCVTAEAIMGVRVSTGVSTGLSAGPASSIRTGIWAWTPEAHTGHDHGQPGRSV